MNDRPPARPLVELAAFLWIAVSLVAYLWQYKVLLGPVMKLLGAP